MQQQCVTTERGEGRPAEGSRSGLRKGGEASEIFTFSPVFFSQDQKTKTRPLAWPRLDTCAGVRGKSKRPLTCPLPFCEGSACPIPPASPCRSSLSLTGRPRCPGPRSLPVRIYWKENTLKPPGDVERPPNRILLRETVVSYLPLGLPVYCVYRSTDVQRHLR